jgi:hypothetical protein
MFSGTAQVSHQVCQFFCQHSWVPRHVAIVVSAAKLRKLRDSLSELRISLCERRPERTVLRTALFPVKTAQFMCSYVYCILYCFVYVYLFLFVLSVLV